MACCHRIVKLRKSFSASINFVSSRLYSHESNSENKDVNKPPSFDDVEISDLLQEQLLSNFEAKPKIDPENTNILLFPGQGSQRIGMADDLLDYPNVREMFNAASNILNFDLLSYCQNGPQSELDQTVHSQPAIFITSLAGVEKIQATDPKALENCCATAGYSVGEFASLVFSGALTFEDAVRLIGIRSRAMQQASDKVNSKMVTAIGGASSRFGEACADARNHCMNDLLMDDPVCTVSAYLCPKTVTIAGDVAAVTFVEERMRNYEIRKILPIPVSGAFHTKLMRGAYLDVKEAIKRIKIEPPIIDVYSNKTGERYKSTDDIKRNLPLQIIHPVKWEQVIHKLLQRPRKCNMPTIYDAGPGNQLGSLLRKCNGKASKNYIPLSGVAPDL